MDENEILNTTHNTDPNSMVTIP